jgi:UDP-N-acetylmuramate--alanine ligase
MVEPPESIPSVAELGTVHLIGIGGRGMSAIARILLARGVTVTGSDAQASPMLTAVEALGARCHIGHDASYVQGADTVVVSSAIAEDNPELVAAREAGLRVLPRTVALVSLMRGQTAVAVAGTHGKTTTTAMLTSVLQHAGRDPSFAVGGNLVATGSNAHHGSGDVFVAETDESDGSFVAFEPDVVVLTNIDADHLDLHGTVAAYRASFDRFIERVEPGAQLIACLDDEGVRSLLDRWAERLDARGVDVLTYGQDRKADVRVGDVQAHGTGMSFILTEPDGQSHEVALAVPGLYNVLNAAACFLASRGLGLSARSSIAGLGTFRGTARRFEAKGCADDVRVYDDFAHHPTEVRAALTAARDVAGEGRVVVVFQSQLYSRTRIFATEFGEALGLADEVVVMDVFGSREAPEPGVTGALIADAVPPPARARFVPSWSDVPAAAASCAAPGDLLLTLGSGDVTLIGPEVLDILAAREASAGRAEDAET